MRLMFLLFTFIALFSSTYANDYPRDCQVSNWTSWSPCNGWCKTELSVPVRVRFRNVTVPSTLNGTKCPHLAEWKNCNQASICPHCNCLGCDNGMFPPGSQSWCMCCESGLGSGCNCVNKNLVKVTIFGLCRCTNNGCRITWDRDHNARINIYEILSFLIEYKVCPDYLLDKKKTKSLVKSRIL